MAAFRGFNADERSLSGSWERSLGFLERSLGLRSDLLVRGALSGGLRSALWGSEERSLAPGAPDLDWVFSSSAQFQELPLALPSCALIVLSSTDEGGEIIL